MSRADVLMRKIREDIAKIQSKTGASTQEEIDVMETALMDLTRRINALGERLHLANAAHKFSFKDVVGLL